MPAHVEPARRASGLSQECDLATQPSGLSIVCHWNGVFAFGTNPPTEAVTDALEWWARPRSTQFAASWAIARTSSSRSVGRPIRKYSLMRRQPWLNAASTAAYRSSSLISLLMTRRMRQVPPSGAKVSPVRRTC